MTTAHSPFESSFPAGGGPAFDGLPSAIERRAAHDLYDGLRRGEFCYVLAPRRTGPSFLMVRTASRVREDGNAVIVLNLTAIGQSRTVEQWYRGLLRLTGHQLGLEAALEEFWQKHAGLGPLQRWMNALQSVVLPRIDARCSMLDTQGRDVGPAGSSVRRRESITERQASSIEHRASGHEHRASSIEHSRLVIFIDEIEAVRSLPFSTDEFFAGIRACYNRRTEGGDLDRLTFCLLGTASPTDLIRGDRSPPFNIGRRIDLEDLDLEDSEVLPADAAAGSGSEAAPA
jgi:hypothetical protein